jgi:uncharacterized protein YjbI with pentapeptide repeats
MIEIRSWINGKVLYTAQDATDVRTALEEAVHAGAELNGAKLNNAKLNSAKLNSAKLNNAKLNNAKLNNAELNYAELNGAELNSAELNSAELNSAELNSAELNGAELNSAELNSAKLNNAKLNNAKLNNAKLNNAELNYAELNGAELSYAELNGAKLNNAKLNSAKLNNVLTRGHVLWGFRQDLWSILDQAAVEVAGLRQHIADGLIDGSVYTGRCACLVGTIAAVRHVSVDDLDIPRDGDRPAEQWFVPIREGDKPLPVGELSKDVTEGVFRASWALRWVDEWEESRRWIGGVLAEAKAA